MVRPLFILSMPRAGSTLLQRVLAADRQIASVAEPWVLLPFIYALRDRGVRADYSHPLANKALVEFLGELPNGRQDYLAAIGVVVKELYQKAAKDSDAQYFLDKTPRYSLIAHELFDTFPDGKFIVLWRNPLAIIASLIETCGRGRWNVSGFHMDLFDGLANLIESVQSRSEKVLAIQYEHFVQFPEQELARIADYLEIHLDAELLKSFQDVTFSGTMGDPTGAKKYRHIEMAPLDKWKTTISNPFRKGWCRRYLEWIGEERMKIMGYDLHEVACDLDSVRVSSRHLLSDCTTIFGEKVVTGIRLVGQAVLK